MPAPPEAPHPGIIKKVLAMAKTQDPAEKAALAAEIAALGALLRASAVSPPPAPTPTPALAPAPPPPPPPPPPPAAWATDDDPTAKWLVVGFPNVGLGNRLRAVASAALLAEDTGRRLAVDWSEPVNACGARLEDLFEPTPALLPRLPRCAWGAAETSERDVSDAARRAGAGLDRVQCWVVRTCATFYPAGLSERDDYIGTVDEGARYDVAAAEAAAARRTRWFARLTPVPAVLKRVAKLGGAPAPLVGAHVRRGDHRLPTMYSPLWLVFRTVDEELAKRGRGRADGGRVVVASDERACEERLLAQYKGARCLAKGGDPGSTREKRVAIRDALADMIALGSAEIVIGMWMSSFAPMVRRVVAGWRRAARHRRPAPGPSPTPPPPPKAAALGGAALRVVCRPKTDVERSNAMGYMQRLLTASAEKKDRAERAAERAATAAGRDYSP